MKGIFYSFVCVVIARLFHHTVLGWIFGILAIVFMTVVLVKSIAKLNEKDIRKEKG